MFLFSLDLGIVNSLLTKHDFVLLLVQAMELQFWSRKDKEGKLYKYVDNKWKQIALSERFQLTKIEGQIWISLYELILNPSCLSKYDYTDFKKNQILKLRVHMNELLLDQIPNLAALQRFLEQLAVSEAPPYKSHLIIEPVLIIYDAKIGKYKGKWRDIAAQQVEKYLNPSDAEIREKAMRWTETYNSEAFENLIEEPAKCAECGQPAPKRCSRCQSEWYCRRECQVKNWPKHKKACDIIVDTNNRASNLIKQQQQQTIST